MLVSLHTNTEYIHTAVAHSMEDDKNDKRSLSQVPLMCAFSWYSKVVCSFNEYERPGLQVVQRACGIGVR